MKIHEIASSQGSSWRVDSKLANPQLMQLEPRFCTGYHPCPTCPMVHCGISCRSLVPFWTGHKHCWAILYSHESKEALWPSETLFLNTDPITPKKSEYSWIFATYWVNFCFGNWHQCIRSLFAVTSYVQLLDESEVTQWESETCNLGAKRVLMGTCMHQSMTNIKEVVLSRLHTTGF